MSQPSRDADRKTNIHAPWRMEYVEMLGDEQEGCFLCRARDETDRDEENLLLWRTGNCLAVLNRFPYTGGHLLIAPAEHLGSLGDLPGEVMREMMELSRDAARLLSHTIKAEGFNIGINIGRCTAPGCRITCTCTSCPAGAAIRTSCPFSATSASSPSSWPSCAANSSRPGAN